MAVFNAPQFVDTSVEPKRLLPIEEHTKARYAYALFKNLTGGALAIGDQVNLFKLPPGHIRLLPYLSRIKAPLLASGTISIGFRAYANADNADNIVEAPNELLNAKSTASAVNEALSQAIKADYYSKSGIIVFATLGGAGFAANSELELILPYGYE